MDNIPKLNNFIYEIKDQSKLEIVEEVIAAFEKNVIGNDEIFEKGLIHGDFNEQNILVHLVGKTNVCSEYKISGVIDFGDSCESNLIFELAIAMAYMMILAKDVVSGGFVLAGYTAVRIIPEEEKKVLRVNIVNLIFYKKKITNNFIKIRHALLQDCVRALLWELILIVLIPTMIIF